MIRLQTIAFSICVLFALLLAGCNEEQRIPQANIKPLDQQLVPTDPNWIRVYGDTQKTRIVYNLAVLNNEKNISRNNEILIANMISMMHPTDVNDPNNLKARIEKLEARDMNDLLVLEAEIEAVMSYYKDKTSDASPDIKFELARRIEALETNIAKLENHKATIKTITNAKITGNAKIVVEAVDPNEVN